ncbi:MAG: response regulator transcription factor [Bacillota bacterium]|nr:response regulator transcription factor [Bacillota bacterium]
MDKVRVLLVDDEPSLLKGVKLSLELEGYEVLTAADGNQALTVFSASDPDLIVLDLMLPGVDGLTVCRRIRETSTTPIIMLTAKADDVDKVVGLEVGADDYLTKPFNTRELVARVRAVLRRVQFDRQAAAGAGEEHVLVLGDLTIDVHRRRVQRGDRPFDLTPTEFDLLAHLAAHPGRVFSREELLRNVWGYEYFGDDRTVDVHVSRLRDKIEPDAQSPVYVLTSWGKGYYAAESGPQSRPRR